MDQIIKSAEPNNPRLTYTNAHHEKSPTEIWALWKQSKVTVYQLAEWQSHHNYYFDEMGNRT